MHVLASCYLTHIGSKLVVPDSIMWMEILSPYIRARYAHVNCATKRPCSTETRVHLELTMIKSHLIECLHGQFNDLSFLQCKRKKLNGLSRKGVKTFKTLFSCMIKNIHGLFQRESSSQTRRFESRP